MKTIPALLLPLLLASCSQPPPRNFQPWAPPRAAAPAPRYAAAREPKPKVPAPTTPAAPPELPAANATTNVPPHALAGPAGGPAAVTPKPTVPPPARSTPEAPPAATPGFTAVPPGPHPNTGEIIPAGTIDFPATDLNQVLQIYAQLVNRTVLRPANLPAPLITLKTQTPLTKKEAIQAFDTVLALNGVAMINVGDKFVKAVPMAQASQQGAAFNTNSATQLGDLGPYVTRVVQLQYVKPSDMVQVLTPFAQAPNAIQPVEHSDILVLRDLTENVKRMLEMIKKVDVPPPSEFVSAVIPIKYAKATDIAQALNSLSTGGASTSIGGGGMGTGAGAARPGYGGGYSRPGYGGYSPGTTGYSPGISTPYGMQSEGITPESEGITPITPQQAAPPQPSFTQRLRSIIGQASGGEGKIEVLGPTKIIADQRSNSLLIFATPEDMKTIKSIVSKLDVVLAQVLIQTIIMDVQMDNGWNYGLSGGQNAATLPHSNLSGEGAVNNGQSFLNVLNNVVTNSFIGGAASALPAGLTYWAALGNTWNLALQAAATDSRINVIQTPQILTTHATPGSIFIGNTVPYITSTYYGTYGGGPSSSYQQLQVGIGLTVTPYINSDGLVVMQISESIDEISGSTAITGVGNVPNTTSRELTAQVAVPDGDTVMLGGFVRNSSDREKSGVPLLKDIPILGGLFSNNSDTKERKELVVLMRPTVLKTPEIAAKVTADFKRQLPGVLGAEAQVKAEEKKEMKREQRNIRDLDNSATYKPQ